MKLVYYEVTNDVWAAKAREKAIKAWTRDKKMALNRSQNPAMKELAPELFGWRAAQFSVTAPSRKGKRNTVSRTGGGRGDRTH